MLVVIPARFCDVHFIDASAVDEQVCLRLPIQVRLHCLTFKSLLIISLLLHIAVILCV